MKITRHLLVTGKVQGVWYREAMRIEAERLGVTGWVRNCRDGTVEAMLQGEEEAVLGLIEWSRRGPPSARVEHVAASVGEGEFDRFDRLPTD